MGKILAELPAIGKDSENKEQKFMFRGIDAVLNALNPIMGRYGVFLVPHEVVELTFDQRTTKAGGALYVTHLLMKYRFYGPRGDYVEAVGIGEGTDTGDKSGPKAMTGGFKYVLFETFAISTREASTSDPDTGSPPETVNPTLVALIARIDAMPEKWADTIKNQMWKKIWDGEPNGWKNEPDDWLNDTPQDWWERTEDLIEKAEARVIAEAQYSDAEASQAPPAKDPTPATTPSASPSAAAAPPTQSVAAQSAPPAQSPSEPDPTPTSSDDSETLSDEASTETGDDGEVTWDQVSRMRKGELQAALKAMGAYAPRYATSVGVDELRLTLWFANGGEPDDGYNPEGGFECPFCNTFGFPRFDEMFAHMLETHSEGSDDNAEGDAAVDSGEDVDTRTPDARPDDATDEQDPSPDASATDTPDPVEGPPDAATLEVVKDSIAALKGGSARAYSEYRKKMGLPARPDSFTAQQAYDLIDFLDKLPTGG